MSRKLAKTLVALSMMAVLSENRLTAMAAPKTMPDGNTFDAAFYASTYPDVAAVFGGDEELLYHHYLTCGKAEGRLPYAPGGSASVSTGNNVQTMPDGGKFDATYYASTYPDIKAVLGTDANALYAHYINCGKAEGRRPYAPGAVSANYAATELLSLKAYETKNHGMNFYKKGQSFPGTYSDIYGNEYQCVLTGSLSLSQTNGQQYRKYYLNGQYDRFQATVAPRTLLDYRDSTTAGQIIISGDGKILFADRAISTATRPYKIDLDITGVTDLKIEMFSAEGGWGIDVILGDPILLKENF
ncbi:MAG: NPCBM/NEW2 domain-containing protein [Lachnospiraceae bacterium]|nr:NPCBM/NEW2 domain-containing protein [Lachnospiraceae bacterium]